MPAMKLGVALPYISAKSAVRLARRAEETGWNGCFMGDAIWCEDPMIALTAAAVATRRIRLGLMVVPVPLRHPWKLASESVALDHLSDGRLILGLGAGAVFMGWQAFPDVATDVKIRIGMLDETIDILTLLYQRKPFDYDGRHFHLKLSLLDEQYYPPKPVQQPRIPLWAAAQWPRKKPMRRILKCDGILVEKAACEGGESDISPADIAGVKSFVDANRTLTTPFDIVMNGKTTGMSKDRLQEKLLPLQEAGTTWWVEGMWDASEEQALERISQGPPAVD
jgi:hypothetical protein